jgi:hypothetical protein
MDKTQAKKFIRALTGEADPVLCWQPIADHAPKGRKARKYMPFHATLLDAWPRFAELQAEGTGIFLTLNETDGQGRKTENITKIRALFIDCDDWKGEQPLRFAIEAGRPGRRHFFFLPEEPIPLDRFKHCQKFLAEIYGSDPSVCDLPRVVRLPGTYNLKGGQRVLHSLVYCSDQRFSIEEIASPKYLEFSNFAASLPAPGPGERNQTLFKIAAQAVNLGIDATDRIALLNNYNLRKIGPSLDAQEVENIARNAEKYAQLEPTKPLFTDAPEPPSSVVDDLEADADYWRGWAYVAATHSFFDLQSMDDYSSEQFNALHLDRFDGKGKPSDILLKTNQIEKFETIVYAPGQDQKINGKRWKRLNLYVPPDVQPVKGELTWFFEHMEYLIPEERERALFIDWMAYAVQNPGRKIHFALVLQGLQGVGKSYFKHLFRAMLGPTNVIEPHGDNLKSRFNGFLKRGQLICIEELMLAGSDGASAVNRLKQWITEDRIMIEDKGRNVVLMENKFNLFCLTNYRDALKIDEHDRRFFVVFSPARPKTAKYYKGLFSEIEIKAANLAFYLINEHQFSEEFEPQGRAPATHAKNLMIESSRSVVESWLKEHIENRTAPFERDLVSLVDIVENDLLPESIRKIPRLSNDLGRYLRRIGAEQLGRVRGPDGKQVRLWAVRKQSYWRTAGAGAIAEHLAGVMADGAGF